MVTARADWNRLSGTVDRNYRRDKTRGEVRLRGDEATNAPKQAPIIPASIQTPLTPNNAPTVAQAPYKPYSTTPDPAAMTAEALQTEIETITGRLTKALVYFGDDLAATDHHAMLRKADPARYERNTELWCALNYRAAELATEIARRKHALVS